MYITWNSTALHLFSYLSHTLPNLEETELRTKTTEQN